VIIPICLFRQIEGFELNGNRFLAFVFIAKSLSEPLQRVDEDGRSEAAMSPEPFTCRTENTVGLLQIAFAVKDNAESGRGFERVETIRTGSALLSLESCLQLRFCFVELSKKTQ
jgi:hypothetical protein